MIAILFHHFIYYVSGSTNYFNYHSSCHLIHAVLGISDNFYYFHLFYRIVYGILGNYVIIEIAIYYVSYQVLCGS